MGSSWCFVPYSLQLLDAVACSLILSRIDYKPVSVPVPQSANVECVGWPVYGNCTIAPPPRRACETTDADQARLLAL